MTATDSFIGRRVAGRYAVTGTIGAGAMGAVYRARQLWLDRDVALKILKQQGSQNPRARRRLHREARVVARISHPNVVQVHDYGETEAGEPFLVMELVPGTSPGARLRTGTLDDVLAAADAALAGLAAAHAQGVLHRDLKPANMILRDGQPGRLVLLDFGIAGVLEDPMPREDSVGPDDGGDLTRAGTVVGTPLYMSPEQARGLAATERSDLYAVGVILFQWLTGAAPFNGPVEEVLRAHVFEPPPPLRGRGGLSVSPELARIVDRALAKSPAARWSSATEMRAALREAGGPRAASWTLAGAEGVGVVGAGPVAAATAPRGIALEDTMDTGAPVPAEPAPDLGATIDSGVQPQRMLGEAPFVGRSGELARIRSCVAALGEGRGQLVLVEGEEGVGKSRLVLEALQPFAEGGRISLGRGGLAAPARAPYALVRAALEDLLGTRDLPADAVPNQLQAVLGEGLGLRERAELATWLRPAAGTEAPPPGLASWGEEALAERALRAAARRRPVVLVLDDAQWASEPTAKLVGRLSASMRLEPLPIGLVLVRRPTADGGALRAPIRHAGEQLERVVVPPLEPAVTEDLLRGIARLDAPTAARLAARASGSPRLAVLMLRHLLDAGGLAAGPQGLHFGSGEWEHALPASLEELLAARLDRLDGEAIEAVLHGAAALGGSFEVALLERVLAAADELPGDDAFDDALDALVAGGVLVEQGPGDRLAWAHPLLRELVATRAGRSRRRRRACRAAAATLAADPGPVTPGVARALVELLGVAGDEQAAATHAPAAGREALAAGRVDAALSLYEQATGSDDPAVARQGWFGIGAARIQLGHAEQAAAAYDAVLASNPDARDAAWAAFGKGRASYHQGQLQPALGSLTEAARAFAGFGDAEAGSARSQVHRVLAAVAARLPGVAVEDLPLDEQLGTAETPAQRCQHRSTAAYDALRGGRFDEAASGFEAAVAELDGEERTGLADILCDWGRALRSAGRVDEAAARLTRGLELARRAGAHRSEAELRNELGELARASGALDEAAEHYERVAAIGDVLRSPHAFIGRLNGALVDCDRQRWDAARTTLSTLRTRRLVLPGWNAPFLLTAALASAGGGADTAARTALEEALPLLKGLGTLPPDAASVLRRVQSAWAARDQQGHAAWLQQVLDDWG